MGETNICAFLFHKWIVWKELLERLKTGIKSNCGDMKLEEDVNVSLNWIGIWPVLAECLMTCC